MNARLLMLCLLPALAGCSGEQSALAPRGDEAASIVRLFWNLTAVAAAVLVAVVGAASIAILGGARARARLASRHFIVGAGVVFPALTLLVLLAYGLAAMGPRLSLPESAVRVTVVGEQWWWRVIHHLPDGATIESANELRIPVGVPVVLSLRSADVIHSFWVPNLAGKVDMIPGRTNYLVLRATTPGASRGQCAEYCGGAHALMSFHVVALERPAYEAWLRAETAPAVNPAGEGARLFVGYGCGACHRVRGLAAATGTIGPDLTHVGGRRSLGAGVLVNDAAAFATWIRDNQHVKPGNRMPPYAMLPDEEVAAIARFLEGLQ